MNKLNRRYGSIRNEDRLIRSLRDRLKVEMFYNELDVNFNYIQLGLEKQVQDLQKLNHHYIIKLCELLGETKSTNFTKETTLYISEHNKTLNIINNEYGWILDCKKTNIINKDMLCN